MTGLLLRFSPGESLVRSVGDPPNGVVAVSSHPEHFGFVVDGHHVPQGAADVQAVSPGALPPHLSPLETAEAVAAAESAAELRFFWVALTGALAQCSQLLRTEPGYLPALEGLTGLIREFLAECES